MGFGFMVLGCIIALFGAFTSLSAFTYVAGIAIMLFSLKELIIQDKTFLVALVSGFALFGCSFAFMILFVLSASTALLTVFSNTCVLLSLVFYSLISYGIERLARRVDLRNVMAMSFTTLAFAFVYVVAFILQRFVLISSEGSIKIINIISLGSQILFSVMFLVLAFNAYVRICYADDKNMEKKTNGTLGYLNEKLDRAMTPKEKRNQENNNKKRG